ncbi:MAG TPA: cytochrome c-type biogenesis protein [Gammaproteobacteria bacterium]|nr:cytochrome c-type biogenesis protein [Gammaproteobacteria bacterium]
MKALSGSLLFVLAVLVAVPVAAEPAQSGAGWHHFDNPAKEQRYQNLLGNLRCLVCQDESLLDSNADLAADLRAQIFLMMKSGESNAQIKQYLTNRYGDYVLFKPPLDYRTYALWFGPFALALLGLVVLVWSIRHRSRERAAAVSDEERARIDELLRATERNDKQ